MGIQTRADSVEKQTHHLMRICLRAFSNDAYRTRHCVLLCPVTATFKDKNALQQEDFEAFALVLVGVCVNMQQLNYVRTG